MDKKIELIKELRMEIGKITVIRNVIKGDYDTCLKKIKHTMDEINRLNVTWCDNREIFENECKKKIGIRNLPVYVFMTLILGYVFGKVIGNEFSLGMTSYIISYGLISVILSTSYFINIDTPNIYHNYKNKRKQRIVNKRRNYLFKKYSYIETIYNDLKSTIEHLRLKEEELSELKLERQNLESKLQEVYTLLDSKEEELLGLEKEYIDIVVNDTTNENSTTITHGKGKTRIRKI